MRFQAGKSGNPGGKARGTRSRVTLAAEALLTGETEALTRKAIELALTGDTVALRLCFERIMPLRKGRPVRFELPKLETVTDLPRAIGAILMRIAAGELTPEEGSAVCHVLELMHKAIELTQIEGRLRALEQKVASS